jgi:hypothetical protein
LRAFSQSLRAINLSTLGFTLSAIALGRAIQFGNGFYNPTALNWMLGALILALLGVATHRLKHEISAPGGALAQFVLLGGIAWQIEQLLTGSPGLYVRADASMTLFKGLVVAQAAAIALGAARVKGLERVWFPAVLIASLFLGVWMIKASPNPYIDVTAVHKEAIEALINGADPYRISFPNIYERALAREFYNPSALFGDRVLYSYPYPPASLLFAVPGHVLFGDYRYSENALLVLGAAFIGFSRRGLLAKLAACLLLTTPRIWFVIEQGWTEPIGVFLLALTVFLLSRSPVAAGFAAGIFVVTKQYLGFTGPAVLRLAFASARRWPWIALSVCFAAAAVTLPLALWHPNAFLRNVVWLQTLEPFRMDSLSFLSWAARKGMGQGSYIWAVSAATVGAAIAAIATRNSPSGFAGSVALTTFAMFSFGSKAFCNYYFFVIAALCCAVAACPLAAEASSPVDEVSEEWAPRGQETGAGLA